jgi:hypothetical protein
MWNHEATLHRVFRTFTKSILTKTLATDRGTWKFSNGKSAAPKISNTHLARSPAFVVSDRKDGGIFITAS